MFLGLTVLDYLLILLLLSYAFTGFRQGLVVSVLSLAGFLTGGAIAMWLVPAASSCGSSASATFTPAGMPGDARPIDFSRAISCERDAT